MAGGASAFGLARAQLDAAEWSTGDSIAAPTDDPAHQGDARRVDCC